MAQIKVRSHPCYYRVKSNQKVLSFVQLAEPGRTRTCEPWFSISLTPLSQRMAMHLFGKTDRATGVSKRLCRLCCYLLDSVEDQKWLTWGSKRTTVDS